METAQTEEAQTALINVQELDVPSIFGDGNTQFVIDYIRNQVANVVPDISTARGRQEIKSAAYRIARSKTLLEDAGKNYAAELKLRVAGIDKNRRTIRDALDALRDEIRKPVTDWEEAELKRSNEIAIRINNLIAAGQLTEGTTKALGKELERVKAIELTEADFGERTGEAAIAKDIAVRNLERAFAGAVKREQDAAELARLRELQREAEQQKTIQEAAERGRQQALAESEERVKKAEREAEQAKAAADRQAQEAKDRADAERRDRESREAHQKAEDDRRAADIVHRRKVTIAARDALMEWASLDQEQAQTVVTLIAAGRIPNISIRY